MNVNRNIMHSTYKNCYLQLKYEILLGNKVWNCVCACASSSFFPEIIKIALQIIQILLNNINSRNFSDDRLKCMFITYCILHTNCDLLFFLFFHVGIVAFHESNGQR